MEVHIYSVKAKSQAGNICVKDIMTTRKDQSERKSAWDLKNLRILPENSAERLASRRQRCWGRVSIYENTTEKLPHLPPKSCRNFT